MDDEDSETIIEELLTHSIFIPIANKLKGR